MPEVVTVWAAWLVMSARIMGSLAVYLGRAIPTYKPAKKPFISGARFAAY
jgi:hypothetical protein